MMLRLTAVSLKPAKGQPAEWPVLINTDYVVSLWPQADNAGVTVLRMIKGYLVIKAEFDKLAEALGEDEVAGDALIPVPD